MSEANIRAVAAVDRSAAGRSGAGRTAHPARALINTTNLKHNLQVLRRNANGRPVMAVIKADAYGHGLGTIALAALDAGARWLGVAQVTEAVVLRRVLERAGVPRPHESGPRLLSWMFAPGPHLEELLDEAIAGDIDLAVSAPWSVAAVAAAVRRTGRRARLHLKIDTGMSRAGAGAGQWAELVQAAMAARDENPHRIELVGIWSHFARADDSTPEGLAATNAQIAEFEVAVAQARELGFDVKIRHLTNTAGLLWHPAAHFDLVRAGISLYGLSPNPDYKTSAEIGVRPVMQLEADLMVVKEIAAGRPVSYGGTWEAPGRRWIGVVPLGYSDGIPRQASSQGIWFTRNGERYPMVGRVCMDQVMIDLGPALAEDGTQIPAPAQPGDTVIAFGDPTDPATQEVASADDWARAAGTINYEIVTRLGVRVPRIPVRGPQAG